MDAPRHYMNVIEDAFGADLDYAMLHRAIYGAPMPDESRYSPATCIVGCDTKVVSGDLDPMQALNHWAKAMTGFRNKRCLPDKPFRSIFPEIA